MKEKVQRGVSFLSCMCVCVCRREFRRRCRHRKLSPFENIFKLPPGSFVVLLSIEIIHSEKDPPHHTDPNFTSLPQTILSISTEEAPLRPLAH